MPLWGIKNLAFGFLDELEMESWFASEPNQKEKCILKTFIYASQQLKRAKMLVNAEKLKKGVIATPVCSLVWQ